jgi:hypothetical protein
VRAKQSRYLPAVLTPGEARDALSHLQGEYWLIGSASRHGEGAPRVRGPQRFRRRRAIRSGTASPPACSSAATASARCRRCWGTGTSRPRRSTPTSCAGARTPRRVRWTVDRT